MGFLSPAKSIVAQALASVIKPSPPPDITAWCLENIEFDDRSPMPGRFNIDRFAFLKEIHEVLSPEDPSREVTVKGSAQIAKTISIIQPTLGAWHEYTPLDSLVVHPTQPAASEWVNNKWLPMRRQAPSLRKVFGTGTSGSNRDATMNQETLDLNGSLKVASAGSPADLTGTSRRLVIMDDVSKYDTSDKGDPEQLSVSRASAFEDAKILRVSTSLIKGTCRITRAYDRSDQRLFCLPCPHCGHRDALTWENFLSNIDPERLHAAHFTCESCGYVIQHSDKEAMIKAGKWIAQNPAGDHPGFFYWRAYSPLRDWASIAVEYAQIMGWRRRIDGTTPKKTDAEATTKFDADSEQVFWNDVLGLAYEQASDAPDWEGLRDRTELADVDQVLPRAVVPSSGVLLAAGVDCQDDRIEVQIVAYGRNRRRWVVDYIIIPHHIGDDEGRQALDAILKRFWKTDLGLPLPLDALAIDGGTYTDDVWSWAKRHPWSRVIIVKGSPSQNGPVMAPMRFERRKDGKAKRRQRRAFLVNVSQLKGDFYTLLRKEDPEERGYTQFGRGLGDEYYRQITSEKKTLTRSRTGVVTAKWELVEPSRRNEALDTMNYSECAARRKGWTSLTDDQWDTLELERGVPPKDDQPDLFDATVRVQAAHEPETEPKTKPKLSEVLSGR